MEHNSNIEILDNSDIYIEKLKELIPVELEFLKNKLIDSISPFIHLSTKLSKANIWNSKIGGFPYLPKDFTHPRNSDGELLNFIMQINFEEMPHLEGYPTSGIIQLYVNELDPELGRFEEIGAQNNFRILYHERVSKDPDSLSDISPIYNTEIIKNEALLIGEIFYETLNSTSQDFLELLDLDMFSFVEKYPKLYHFLENNFHKIGGYPYFEQEDHRTEEDREYNKLLFQIKSEGGYQDDFKICISDGGVVRVFVKEEDLKSLNFKNIFYEWD